MLLGEFLNTLAVNSGVSAESSELKAILSNTNVSGYEIPDSIVSKVQGNYFTLDAAKNNPTLVNHFRAQLFNGVDTELQNTLNELGLSENFKSDFEIEKSTPKRISLALKKISALEKEKNGASKGDKAALQTEIDKLHADMKGVKENYETQISKLKLEHEGNLLNYDLTSLLNSYKYSLPEAMDMSLKTQTAKLALDAALKNKDAKLVRDENGALKLKRASQDIDFFDEKNEKIDVKTFIDSTLAQNNLLAINTPQTTNQTQPAIVMGSNSQTPTTQSWESAMTISKAQVAK